MKRGILIRLRKSRALKYITAFMGVTFLNSLIFPMIAKADGPIAPEFSSFEQVNATQMVDPFTGDFSYNIPLLTVPGPDGGYPINLIYNAGITPDQEASWVGLGWNLNVGAITRQMRGVPDDFDGTQMMTKDIHVKPNVTVEIGGGLGVDLGEIFGMSTEYVPLLEEISPPGYSNPTPYSASLGLKLIYNNYKGLGFGYETGVGVRLGYGLGVSAGVAYDPNSGIQTSTGFSVTNGKYGVNLLNIGVTTSSREVGSRTNMKCLNTSFSTVRTDFAPEIQIPFDGVYNEFEGRFGLDNAGIFTEVTVRGMYGRTKPKSNSFTYAIYGYNNDEKSYDHLYTGIRDYSKGEEYPMSKQMKMLAPPIHTYDIYSVNAQGLSMTFRPFRSDVPVLNPVCAKSENTNNNGGLEHGISQSIHWGANVAHREINTYSEVWPSENSIMLNYLEGDFQAGIQPFYYKAINDLATEADNDDLRYGGNSIVTPYINNYFDDDNWPINPLPQISGPQSVFTQAKNRRTERDLSSTSIEYFTNNEANSIYSTYKPGVDTYSGSPFYANDEIGVYSILGEDGSRYEFALPVYADKEDVTFAIQENSNYPAVVTYDNNDVSSDNEHGKDNFFQKTYIPKYATQYNLTAIYSADYVDIDNNGPSANDLGNYIKFTYDKKANDFGVRYPYYGANYMPGNYSNSLDDRAGFSYTNREQYYLSKIETKTHIAYFRIASRGDNLASIEGNQDISGNGMLQSYKLESIDLYCKTDPLFDPATSVPVKTVHFEYDDVNPLCQGAPGSPNGKLTLKKVWFEYKGNTSGESSPYEFSYANNYAYHDRYADKWGTYKPESTTNNYDDPYVDQRSDQTFCDDRNEYSSAWNLNSIHLPSGGVIDVEYEMDDYAYVQSKPAMHMSEIVGIGNSTTTSIDQATKFSVENNRIFFKLETQAVPQGVTDVQSYYEGIIQNKLDVEEYIYFNCFMNLNYNLTELDYNQDYVSGFAKIKNGDPEGKSVGCIYDNNSDEFVGFVDVDKVRVEKKNPDSYTHPITKAAWQYLYNDRPDLFYPDQGDAPFGLSLVQSIITSFQEHSMMIKGFYKYMYTTDCANKIRFTPIHRSFIRIPDLDGCMYGGGHRVKTIKLVDNWGEISPDESEKSTDYIQTYSYKLADGRSSGVASNEPLAGGDECALRELLYTYSGENVEEYNGFCVKAPVCGDFYPAPVVGYSRVVVSNGPPKTENQTFNKSGTGYEVFEYYTAKDYPVSEKFESVNMTPPYEECIPIPLIGSKIYNVYSFSQGFQVITNDMHGKPKAQKTYKSGDNCDDIMTIPVSEKQYMYKTSGAGYSPNASNTLDNIVPTLFGSEDVRNVEMGVSRDFFIDRKEDRLESRLRGAQTNATLLTAFLIPVVVPEKNTMFALTRKTTSIKVIHQTGILEKVVSTAEGRKSETNLLAYDAATGQPLWSSTNNEFDRPVYSYSYPAHWYYSGMGLASSNYRFTLENVSISSGAVNVGSSNIGWFQPGDELMDQNNNLYWVNDVDNTTNYTISLLNENNQAASNGSGLDITVIRSGHRNLLLEQCGVEQSLNWGNSSNVHFFGEVLLELMNSIFEQGYFLTVPTATTKYYKGVVDCEKSYVSSAVSCSSNCASDYISVIQTYDSYNSMSNFAVTIPLNCPGIQNYIPDFYAGLTGNISLLFHFDVSSVPSLLHSRIVSLVATLPSSGSINGSQCTLTIEKNEEYSELSGYITETSLENRGLKCFSDDAILHSEAYEYSDDADRIYADAGTLGVSEATIAANPFRYGAKGKWQRIDSYLFYKYRTQSQEIDLSADGVYKSYTPFDWGTSNNPDWWKTSEVTKRNPDGMPIETLDRLGNYSSLMFGHTGVNRSGIMAAASNSTYYEMSFDGFEDHGSTYNSNGRGHLKFLVDGQYSPTLSTDASHTGKYSVLIDAGSSNAMVYTYDFSNPADGYFAPQISTVSESKKYVVSAWVKMQGDQSNAVTVNVICNSISLGSFVVSNTGAKIDGWKLVSGEFTMPTSAAGQLSISISSGNASAYIDDVRIHPFNSQMVTAVYDLKTMRISAMLDENNYASYFIYDLRGNLVQVKKETEKGTQTVKASWMNVFKITGN